MAPITASHRIQRSVLLAPAAIAKAAATQVKEPEEQWMLRQSKKVRASYVRDVLDRGGHERQYQRMLADHGDDPSVQTGAARRQRNPRTISTKKTARLGSAVRTHAQVHRANGSRA